MIVHIFQHNQNVFTIRIDSICSIYSKWFVYSLYVGIAGRPIHFVNFTTRLKWVTNGFLYGNSYIYKQKHLCSFNKIVPNALVWCGYCYAKLEYIFNIYFISLIICINYYYTLICISHNCYFIYFLFHCFNLKLLRAMLFESIQTPRRKIRLEALGPMTVKLLIFETFLFRNYFSFDE